MSVTKLIAAALMTVSLVGCAGRTPLADMIRIEPYSHFDRSEKYQMSQEAKLARMKQLNECRYRGANLIADYTAYHPLSQTFDIHSKPEPLPVPKNGKEYTERDNVKEIKLIMERNEIRQNVANIKGYCRGIDPLKIDHELSILNSYH